MTFLIQSIGEIMLIAFSMTLLIIAGEIDLSVSSTAALSSCTLGFVWQHTGNIPLAVVSGARWSASSAERSTVSS